MSEQDAPVMKGPAVRITNVHQEIESEHYFTAMQGARMEGMDYLDKLGMVPHPQPLHPSLVRVTFCVLVLRNGFTVTGESTCVSTENYDEAYGRRLAKEKAVDKAWGYMGFRLADELARDKAYREAAEQVAA